MPETLLSYSEVLLFGRLVEDLLVKKVPPRGKGKNRHLSQQLGTGTNPKLARICGFAYEGTYYELPAPTIFLVDGDGESAINAPSGSPGNPVPPGHAARAPLNPSVTGVAAANYQLADDVRYWPYDKADDTIRMDVTTGMIEQVLLDMYFGFEEPAIAGAKVSGAKVSGAKVSGAKVSGAKARGPGD